MNFTLSQIENPALHTNPTVIKLSGSAQTLFLEEVDFSFEIFVCVCFVFETSQALRPSSLSFDLPFLLLKSQDNLANSGDIHSFLNFLYFRILPHLILSQ